MAEKLTSASEAFQMTAVFFLVYYGLGGSTIALVPYVQVLIEKGFDVHVVCRRRDLGANLLEMYGAKIAVLPFPMGLNITAMEQFYPFVDRLLKVFKDIVKFSVGFILAVRAISRIKPDLVVVSDFTLLQVILASKLLRIKTIALVQTSFSHSELKKRLIRKVLRLSDGIVGITEPHLRQVLAKCEEAPSNRLFVVRNTVMPAGWSPSEFDAFYERLHITTPHMVLFVGGCSRVKGSLEFIQSAVEILSRRNDVSFVLAGPFHRYFKTEYAVGTSNDDFEITREVLRIKQLQDPSDRIKIVGETTYITPLLGKAKFLMAPSNYPHFLRPVIEAWSFGKPSIVTNDEFGRYLISHGENGFLVQKGEKAGFVQQCNLLLDDADLCRTLGEAGYRTYKTLYESKVVIQSVEYLLDVVLQDGRGGRV